MKKYTNMDKKEIQAKILIVEDEIPHAETLKEILIRSGHTCVLAHDGNAAEDKLSCDTYDIVITDLFLGGGKDGLDVLAIAKEKSPAAQVILITGHSSIETCRKAIQEGAFDYIEKPLDLDELRLLVDRAANVSAQNRTVKELRTRLDEKKGFEDIIGKSEHFLKRLDILRRVAKSDISVLLTGESGTGKELFANAIHQNSPRKDAKFVAINCAGLSETLLEDELFGHVKGAYTGAQDERVGRFEHADGGTLFLDEIGDMPLTMQAKLLRVLENGEVVRVGSNEAIRVDIRLVSATNCDLGEKVKAKEFREDLYFRVKGAAIEIPPLRTRRDDIPLLVEHFIKMANEKHGTKIKGISSEVNRLLMSFSWPGNVRQAKHVVENMVILAEGEKLTIDDLPPEVYSPPVPDSGGFRELAGISIEEAEKELIKNTLKMVGGNRNRASGILGIGERTLYRKIKEYKIEE